MTYNPNIPNATDNISVSQNDLKINFQQLENIFDNDHYTWDFATTANRGAHRQVNFKLPISDPAVVATESFVYSKADANDSGNNSQLYFANTLGVTRLTNRFTAAAQQGYTILPSGIVLMWGFSTGPFSSTDPTPIEFHVITNYPAAAPKGFPNNCFNVVGWVEKNDTSSTRKDVALAQTSITREQFSVRCNSASINAVYWFAIGN
jgi:hypothetical protein